MCSKYAATIQLNVSEDNIWWRLTLHEGFRYLRLHFLWRLWVAERDAGGRSTEGFAADHWFLYQKFQSINKLHQTPGAKPFGQ